MSQTTRKQGYWFIDPAYHKDGQSIMYFTGILLETTSRKRANEVYRDSMGKDFFHSEVAIKCDKCNLYKYPFIVRYGETIDTEVEVCNCKPSHPANFKPLPFADTVGDSIHPQFITATKNELIINSGTGNTFGVASSGISTVERHAKSLMQGIADTFSAAANVNEVGGSEAKDIAANENYFSISKNIVEEYQSNGVVFTTNQSFTNTDITETMNVFWLRDEPFVRFQQNGTERYMAINYYYCLKGATSNCPFEDSIPGGYRSIDLPGGIYTLLTETEYDFVTGHAGRRVEQNAAV